MNYKKKISKLSSFLYNLSIKFIKKDLKYYQNFENKKNGSRKETDQRWRLIKKIIIKEKIKNILDLGSAEGFFIKKFSDMGIFSLGIEGDERRFLVSNHTLNKNKYKNYAVVHNKIALKFVEKIPEFQSILYLSVHHHILAALGKKNANLILKEIFKKSKRSMFFETAMHDEKSKEWNNNYKINLKDISENNIKLFFKKLGARKVEIIGYTKAYNKGYKRPLFYIKK
jgi:hypothetical protein